MKSQYVIALLAGIVLTAAAENALAQGSDTKHRFDSLFVIASSGEVMFRDMVEPAKDSIAAMGERVVPLLIDKFTTNSARERWTVIHVLQRIGSPAVPHLVKALEGDDGLITQRVCWSLGDIKDSTAVDPLMAVCTHERWQVRDQAVGALGKIGVFRAAGTVAEALVDSIGQVRKSAAVACGRLAANDAIPALTHVLGDDFYGARMTAMESLLKLDTARVTAVLADSIDSAEPLVGHLACRILGEYATDAAYEILVDQVFSLDPNRRAHASVALIEADPADTCGFHTFMLEREPDRFVRLKMQSALSPTLHE